MAPLSPASHQSRKSPVSLSAGQRVSLLGMRSLMAGFRSMARLRKHDLPQPVTTCSYGNRAGETLELILPRPDAPARPPVFYVHGGGWIAGCKELYTGALGFLAEAGYPVVNLDYPLAPENPHPEMLKSLLGALEWTRAYLPGTDSVHFMGDSAGGNLALMLSLLLTNPELLAEIDPDLDAERYLRPRSAVSLYGVLDRLSWLREGFPASRLMLLCYGGEAAFSEEVGPELALTPMDLKLGNIPPTFIAAGSKDRLAESSRLCAERFSSEASDLDYKVYEGEQHGFFNFEGRPASKALRADILEFLAQH